MLADGWDDIATSQPSWPDLIRPSTPSIHADAPDEKT
jgi:hypothetical protein